ncbi:sulfatase-like hydrolase/transferase [Paenibacillus allorhizosphaerae]|uniref:Arylsulfatase n=1 Tax=Paenibacillus allorhizosphaerae TaxID=2849866 RepID=A0ABN7TDU4_9BACL|nr:sulfatase-like hydrolase/transferase [Paenibacillus allorhizosphaerae]CAG7617628.1 Arylsulfatase [Paenibacillus allorhizosphaerae]
MQKRPNLLIIMADQLRYDCVGYSRGYPVHTPNLDRLASEGMGFSHAYTHIPLCCPARQSFMNGRRAETFGSLWNFNIALPIPGLAPEQYVWPRELAALGYRARYFGKWGVHPEHDPTCYGYERYVGEGDYQHFKANRYPQVKYTHGYFGEADPIPLEDARTHWFARQTVDSISELTATGTPWHIRLNFSEPHLPCRPAGRFASMYDPDAIPEWHNFQDNFLNKPYIQRQQLLNWQVHHYKWSDWQPVVARYYGMVSQVDDAVGLVLQQLEALGIADETIVVFTSDHGDMCGAHRMMDKHYILYDDVVKVPLIVKYPGLSAPGTVCDAFVYNLLDVPPTILELLELQAPDSMQGRSLLPLLQGGGNAPTDWRDAVVASYNGQQFGLYTQRMIRTKDWKYIWNTTDVDELYDLAQDPGELNNRITDPAAADTVKQLRTALYLQLIQDGDGLAANHWMKDQLLLGNKL